MNEGHRYSVVAVGLSSLFFFFSIMLYVYAFNILMSSELKTSGNACCTYLARWVMCPIIPFQSSILVLDIAKKDIKRSAVLFVIWLVKWWLINEYLFIYSFIYLFIYNQALLSGGTRAWRTFKKIAFHRLWPVLSGGFGEKCRENNYWLSSLLQCPCPLVYFKECAVPPSGHCQIRTGRALGHRHI